MQFSRLDNDLGVRESDDEIIHNVLKRVGRTIEVWLDDPRLRSGQA